MLPGWILASRRKMPHAGQCLLARKWPWRKKWYKKWYVTPEQTLSLRYYLALFDQKWINRRAMLLFFRKFSKSSNFPTKMELVTQTPNIYCDPNKFVTPSSQICEPNFDYWSKFIIWSTFWFSYNLGVTSNKSNKPPP